MSNIIGHGSHRLEAAEESYAETGQDVTLDQMCDELDLPWTAR